MIYHAKRLLEVNESDRDAGNAVSEINQSDLFYTDRNTGNNVDNPFFRVLDKRERLDFLRTAQLVEREAGYTICSFGDESSAIFIILKGSVGVVLPPTSLPENPVSLAPAFVLEPGEVIGELAFALGQRRTATLVSLSSVALLAFEPARIETFYRLMRADRVKYGIDQFLLVRILRYVITSLDAFLGPNEQGPLAGWEKPWEELVEFSRISDHPWRAAEVLSTRSGDFEQPGIHVLLSGTLKMQGSDAIVSGSQLPIVHVNLPRLLEEPADNLELQDSVHSVRILHIAYEGLMIFGRTKVRQIADEIRNSAGPRRPAAELAKPFDLFLSYSSVDREWVNRLREALESHKIKVWMADNQLRPGNPWIKDLEEAMANCHAVGLVVSPHSLESGWVQQEYHAALRLCTEARPPISLIPIILRLNVETKMPLFLGSRQGVDFREDRLFGEKVEELINTIAGQRKVG